MVEQTAGSDARRMKNLSQQVTAAQAAARAGLPPHAIVRMLRESMQQLWPDHPYIVPIEHCMRHAFGIPLRTVRDIEAWRGLSPEGQLHDDELDMLLAPWIQQFLQQS